MHQELEQEERLYSHDEPDLLPVSRRNGSEYDMVVVRATEGAIWIKTSWPDGYEVSA
jgi:hypothetical protein